MQASLGFVVLPTRELGEAATEWHPPAGKTRVEWCGCHRLDVRKQVNGNHGSASDPGPHRVDGYIVQRRTVDQQVSVGIDRGEDARQRQAGSHRMPQCAALVHDLLGPGQVSGNVELFTGQLAYFAQGKTGFSLAPGSRVVRRGVRARRWG